ncbi:MAG: hypothetical protein U1E78_11060 [Gammaproteobacteria bacterium]
MAEKVDDLTVNYFEGELQTVKETDKAILTKGAWATIIFKCQNLDKKTGQFGPDYYTIRRYQKRNNEYKAKSKFNISSKDQAQKIIDVLSNWIK